MTQPSPHAPELLGQMALLNEQVDGSLLGVPVRYRSNSATVIAVAARALAVWRDLPRALSAAGPPVQVAVVVHPLGAGDPVLPPAGHFVARAYGDTFLAASGGNLLTANLATGSATAFVTPALVADEPNLRHRVIERLGLLLASDRDRTPLPAAGIVRDGRAVLLVSPSAAEKSTLCYACVQVGFSLLAEDNVYVSLARGLRVWGQPGPLHLPPEAARYFPELAALVPQVGADGTPKIATDGAAHWPERLATHADRSVVCLLAQSPGQASRLESVSADEASVALCHAYTPDLDRLRERWPAVAHALAVGGAYRLHVGADPHSAAALLAHLAEC
ncbi:MAG: hypothetical protein WCG26_00655 [Chloroflexales bacterium]